MGIPGLATRLEPYAARYTSAELDGYGAIIDGPALAYFGHRIAAEANKSRLPSYADINAAAIRWLNHLETTRIKVSVILFDGALPPAKKDERSARLLSSVRRVTQLNVMHSGATCPVPLQLGSVVYPLLAPSLMEALLTSDFAHVTRMVPGEADEWCASEARKHPHSMIFTSDTDLLLYDYPAEVLVNFLKDGDILPDSALKLYSPSKICEQLKLKSLVQLAYAIQNDRWKSLSEIAREARSHNSEVESSRYGDFNKRYIANVQPKAYPLQSAALDASLQALDARISEFILQTLSLSQPPEKEHPLALSVFLPLFMEDPFSASAWKQGQDIRTLAYSLLATRRVVIQEHIRKAQGMFVQELSVETLEQASVRATELTRTLLAGPKDLANDRYWTLIAAQLALQTLKPPHISLLSRVVIGEFDNTWSYIHLLACIQAGLYSLRVLKQCIAVWLALHPAESSEDLPSRFHDTILKLHEAFSTFPTIAESFTVPGQGIKGTVAESPELLERVKSTYLAAGINNEELFQEAKSKRQKKREKRERSAKRVQLEPQTGVSSQLSSNVFAILDQGR